MRPKRKRTWDEQDAFTGWRRRLYWQPGEIRRIKERSHRYDRRVSAKSEINEQTQGDILMEREVVRVFVNDEGYPAVQFFNPEGGEDILVTHIAIAIAVIMDAAVLRGADPEELLAKTARAVAKIAEERAKSDPPS